MIVLWLNWKFVCQFKTLSFNIVIFVDWRWLLKKCLVCWLLFLFKYLGCILFYTWWRRELSVSRCTLYSNWVSVVSYSVVVCWIIIMSCIAVWSVLKLWRAWFWSHRKLICLLYHASCFRQKFICKLGLLNFLLHINRRKFLKGLCLSRLFCKNTLSLNHFYI